MDNKLNKIFKDRNNILNILEPHTPKVNLMYYTREERERRRKNERWFGFSLSVISAVLLVSMTRKSIT